MKKIPIIIDCDPGVDDSFALALANSSDLLDILAITPVEGNVPAELTRRNALAMAETLDIPCVVAFGAEQPFYNPWYHDASNTHGKTGVGTVEFGEIKKQPDPRPAWEVIYEEAVRHSGEMILLAVGPLTNIATCLRLHPDLPRHLKKFVIMGGGTFGNVSRTNQTAEFNIWVDARAAAEVFEQLEVWMVGLNATHAAAVEMSDFTEMAEICSAAPEVPAAALLRELARFSKQNCEENGSDNNAIHDALAVASILDPEVVGFAHHYVYVESGDDSPNFGQTVIDFEGTSGKAPNCHVAVTVDQPRFVSMMKNMCRHYASAKQMQ